MVVLITGSGSGIGYTLALAFAKKGHSLALIDINPEGLAKTARAAKELGGNCFSYLTDVTDFKQVVKLEERIRQDAGNIDVLINNAGIAMSGDFIDTPIDEWRKLMEVNFWGYIYMLKAFLPNMLTRKSGHIVNVSSTAGLIGVSAGSAYCSSKFAVTGISEALFSELKDKGIKVTLICPSYVRTPIFNSMKNFGYTSEYAEYLNRLGIEPEKTANTIIRSVKRGRFLVIPGHIGKIGYLIKRISLRASLKIQRYAYRYYQRFRGEDSRKESIAS